MVEIMPLALGDVLELKKSHACGANEWEVTRLGMDVGLKCLNCRRRVMVPRDRLDRRFKAYLRRAPEAEGSARAGGASGAEAPIAGGRDE